MLKTFPLPVKKFPLPEYFPTASEDRIQQYLQNEHYALWEVIEFGDSYEAPQEVADTGSASEGSAKKKGRTVAVTTEDMQKRRNDVKARTTLLLALPDEHQLRFSKYKTAQELWAAILKTFAGKETLEQTFNRLQAIISHLKFIDVEIEQDDLNQKFLTSLAPEWLMYTIVWRNRSDLDTMSLDDLYNHLKVYDPEVQKKSESNSYNMAFISSAKTNSGKEEVNTASFPLPALKRADRFWKKTRKRLPYKGSKTEEQTPKALMAIDGVGWDWSYMANEEENHALVADEEASTKFALMAKSSSDTEELEELKKEKEGLDSKLTGFQSASKDLDTLTLLGSQRPFPSIESNSSDLQNSDSSVFEKGDSSESIMSKPMIKFIKATDSPTEDKISKVETIRKPSVKYAKMYRNTTKSPKGNSQNVIDDKGYYDSGCSRHMTGNISYLSEYESYDGGYVSFGQGGGKITGKGIIKTGKLEFKNVYFVKDLKYNLISVSQIYDNKNSFLFTDSECIVLGRDFKLKDDTNVLLRTPRQHNMYSIDLNNIVPHKDLTCLVANASADESVMWHRRLGHLNFKTMNKLVRHNLVRGLPSKCFENDHTCVAFLKGKQHKASFKTKLVHSVTKPLHTLHMDMFGPTFISSLNRVTMGVNLEIKRWMISAQGNGLKESSAMLEPFSRMGLLKEEIGL
nr:putative ribonuclease H-like domain-containing protein [Tanacetum cinerariifolium]